MMYHYDTGTELIDTNGDGIGDMLPGQYYSSLNNRLMYYEVLDISGSPQVMETVWYEYDGWFEAGANGNPTWIVRKVEGEPLYRGTTLQYNSQGELWFATEQTWEQVWNPENEWWDCVNDQTVQISEFRGTSRARHLVRQRNPEASFLILPGTSTWSDYDGDDIYGDYTVMEEGPNAGDVVNTMAYLPGIGQMDSQTGAVRYSLTDHLGTLRAVTADAGQVLDRFVFTAFGEKVFSDGVAETRYEYAGDWGYESGLLSDTTGGSGSPGTPASGAPFQHVGFRWYSPATGRFLQRDPIGILGGANVYEYASSHAPGSVDPAGLAPHLGGCLRCGKMHCYCYHPDPPPPPVDWGHIADRIHATCWTLGGLIPDEWLAAGGRIPVLDPGRAQNITLTAANAASLVAPSGATVRVITMGGKAVRAAQQGGRITRTLLKIRRYIRWDRPHHGRPRHWDGRWIGGG